MCLDAVCTGKNSNITLAALSFILILPEILLSAQGWDSLLSEAQAVYLGAGRNLLENSHHLLSLSYSENYD
jgi:hypothetical protein